jgi:tRNA threonylcarbamoyladenosine biosynthesis protein TsaB
MILAIDTSTQWMGMALADSAMVWYEKVWKTSRRHTVELGPAIRQLLDETGVDAESLTAVAVALGPGSFTSLRIGLAMAKGLSLALHIPIIGIPSLDITANSQAPGTLPMICMLKSGRERLATCDYSYMKGHWQAVSDIHNLTIQEISARITSPTIICGEIDAQERQQLKRKWRNALVADPSENIRRPTVLAALALNRLEHEDVDSAIALAPIYLQTLGNPTV